jgi:hypothetical protein
MDVSDQLHASAALPPGEEHPVPIGYESGWAPEPVWTYGEKKNLFPLPGIEPQFLGRPARSLIFLAQLFTWILARENCGSAALMMRVVSWGDIVYSGSCERLGGTYCHLQPW